ncbi:hypothetical protein GSI_02812 [Ganoderma sinense ZZ0214-1]|uniref:DUF6534 domain-containing protein n=1 Tax=Ganoderma sinense ZZ0214-1 TaxID=1077348 RepID=A0A2G8SMN0_9APHY|nr:hypothetical protein GSI_02812 [Ganoderma sinense ZZ0214-1]
MEQPSSPLALPPSALATIREALSCVVLGTIISTAVYGLTVLQAYIYFRHNNTSPRTRYFVAFLFALDTATIILTLYGFYDDFVTHFDDVLSFLKIPGTLALENLLTVLIGLLTQCFFAHRIWALSKGNVLLVSSIVILALCSFGPGVAISAHLWINTYIFSLGSLEVRMLAGFANGLSVICDLLIAAAMCMYLNTKRTGFRRTDSIIDRLMMYAINRGLLTATCQACHMILTIAFPGRLIYFPFALLDGKLYCNTLLATLNAQRAMRGDEPNIIEVGSHMLNPIDSSTAGHGSRRTLHGKLDSASASMPSIRKDFSGAGKAMVSRQ